MEITYTPKKFKPETLEVIEQANAICEEYANTGFSLTLRQLFYQFVSRDLLPNNQHSYDRLGSIISDARLAGKFDWNYIIDRTRNLQKQPSWSSPERLVEDAAEAFHMDLWAPQKRRLEVWIEKDAAIGVIEHVCDRNSIPYFSCRGYTSQSEMWAAATRIGEYLRNGEQTIILHIGDHDPSGLDMTRDIGARLRLFINQDWFNEFGLPYGQTRGAIRQAMREIMREQGSTIGDDDIPWEVKRIALTREQIEQYNPPPNYAKQSDSRFERYVEETGLDESWELDALDPIVMEDLIQDEIDDFKDHEAYDKAEFEQEKNRAVLKAVSENWANIKAVHTPKVEVKS